MRIYYQWIFKIYFKLNDSRIKNQHYDNYTTFSGIKEINFFNFMISLSLDNYRLLHFAKSSINQP